MSNIKTGIILNGGNYTFHGDNTTPSTLIPINGKCILTRQIDQLLDAGVTNILISTFENHEKFDEYLNQIEIPKGVNIYTTKETVKLGSGGAIKNTMLSSNIEHAYVLNGNSFINVDLKQVASIHNNSDYELTVVVTEKNPNEIKRKYSIKDNLLIEHDPSINTVGSAYLYVIDQDLWNQTHLQQFSITKDFIPESIKHGINAFKSDSEVIFISTKDEFESASKSL